MATNPMQQFNVNKIGPEIKLGVWIFLLLTPVYLWY